MNSKMIIKMRQALLAFGSKEPIYQVATEFFGVLGYGKAEKKEGRTKEKALSFS